MIDFGTFRYDPEARLLYRGDDEIVLSMRVVAVLESFLKRPGQIVQKDDILASAWEGAFVGEDSLTQAVSQLRSALGDDPRAPTYIQTIPKRGYRFIAPVSAALESTSPVPRAPPDDHGVETAARDRGGEPEDAVVAFDPGVAVGRYELIARVGAGAMGEVWRARDTDLRREVALKVVPEMLVGKATVIERLRREALMLAALKHPNIATIHGIEEINGTRFIVMELLEGETLQARLRRGPLKVGHALEIALQITRALEVAHDAGIVHRDLKPANIMLLPGGQVKVLDFGLAKNIESPEGLASADPTGLTVDGSPIGTVAYMSPEQARGHAVDRRADIWAFGCVLHELLTNRVAFAADTSFDTLVRVIEGEPDWGALPNETPASVRRLLRRCLRKPLAERLQHIGDARIVLQDALDAPEDASEAPLARDTRAWASPRSWRRRALPAALALLLVVVAAALAYEIWRGRATDGDPLFTRLTFRRGWLTGAAFSPEGGDLLYSAAWQDDPLGIFAVRPVRPESLPLLGGGVHLEGISAAGELAVLLDYSQIEGWTYGGTLARAPMAAGEPREVLENITAATWCADGQELAIVREVNGRSRLEYPIGTPLFETSGFIPSVICLPDGGVAFLHAFQRYVAGADIVVIDRRGIKRTLATRVWHGGGLVWHPISNELWYMRAVPGDAQAMSAVDLDGNDRQVLHLPGEYWALHDAAANGQLIISRDTLRMVLMAKGAEQADEQDLSWFDFSWVLDISSDGRFVFFDDSGRANTAFTRDLGGGPAREVAPGYAIDLSPDDQRALILSRAGDMHIVPLAAGEPTAIPLDDLSVGDAVWFPQDGSRLLLHGNPPDGSPRLYVLDLEDGEPRPITPEGMRIWQYAIHPDETRVAAVGSDNVAVLYDVTTGESQPLPGARPYEAPVRWSADGRYLFLRRNDQVFRIDPASGERSLWQQIGPADATGFAGVMSFAMTADGSAYAYTYFQVVSELFLVDGVR